MSPGEDFEKISLHLIWQHAGRPPLRGKHPEMDAVLQGAWRYSRISTSLTDVTGLQPKFKR
jgi:hypothetical protein